MLLSASGSTCSSVLYSALANNVLAFLLENLSFLHCIVCALCCKLDCIIVKVYQYTVAF